jgi:GH15 family glucan-1,4-alpha-glucosidase
VSQRLEDYALIGDTHTAALVGRDGSLDWLCAPRFDSAACFAALLGTADNGRWLLAPTGGGPAARRYYQEGTLVLVQEWDTPGGTVRVTDFMPPRHHRPRVCRRVEGLRGSVDMVTEVVVRFEYGSLIPWVVQTDQGIRAVAGPDSIELNSPVTLEGEDMQHHARFTVGEGQVLDFRLLWAPSYEEAGRDLSVGDALAGTMTFWADWSSKLNEVHGDWEQLVQRSLITLKALTYAPTGGIVAAPTTSLPEEVGGSRNWDYRFCWIRDATLIEAGNHEEAREWLWWLVRAAAGDPAQLQIMYGVAGERRLPELELGWLAGYDGSTPVRVGNAASLQFQLDIYGELMEAIGIARGHGVDAEGAIWDLQRALINFVEGHWDLPDQGIWELRGPPQALVYSRVMAWVAMDEQVCTQGYNAKVGAFTQAYGSDELDASVLMMPLVGFLPIEDPRVVSTIEAVKAGLMADGFVIRYHNTSGVDGLPGSEGTFLPCTLWMVSCLALLGRVDEARQLLMRVASVANDVGLFAEEYDTRLQRLVGNFPQAFTHVAFINAARYLARAQG